MKDDKKDAPSKSLVLLEYYSTQKEETSTIVGAKMYLWKRETTFVITDSKKVIRLNIIVVLCFEMITEHLLFFFCSVKIQKLQPV